MKKYCVRIIVLALTTALIVGTFPTTLSSRAFAAQAETMNVNQDDNLTDVTSKALKLRPFTGTKDLIAAMKAELSQRSKTDKFARIERSN